MNAREFLDLQDAYQGVYQELDELWKGRHGQSDTEYQAGRSDAGKRISGDEKTGPRHYTLGRARGAKPDAPTAPGARPVNTPKLSDDEKQYHQYNKSGAKRRSEYNKVGGSKGLPEEVENWVNSLIEEGYDLSDYTWDEMAEIYLDEAKSKLPTRGIDPELYSQFYGNASRSKKVKGKKTSQPGQNRYLAQQNQKRSAKRYEADMGRDRTPSASDYDNHGGGSRNEEINLFDTILKHLVAEGYADTNESALAIMANMSEEWREEILDEAVRGSGRSIADRITGNDIRKVTRGDKSVYKKPKWKDEVENKVDRQFPSTRRTQTSNTYDGGRDSTTIKANKKSINRMNAAKNIEHKQADGDYENPIDHSKPYGKGKSGYMEVPTDHRARKRRASGR